MRCLLCVASVPAHDISAQKTMKLKRNANPKTVLTIGMLFSLPKVSCGCEKR